MEQTPLELHLSASLRQALDRAAGAEGRTAAALAGLVLAQWLRENGHLPAAEDGTRPEDLNASNDD